MPCPLGTRLLEAPEIRLGEARGNPEFDIDAALRTDVFSFGLLAWEVLKTGQRFVDRAWFLQDPEHLMDIDSLEHFLTGLPENGLLIRSLEFTEALGGLNETVRIRLLKMFVRGQPAR